MRIVVRYRGSEILILILQFNLHFQFLPPPLLFMQAMTMHAAGSSSMMVKVSELTDDTIKFSLSNASLRYVWTL